MATFRSKVRAQLDTAMRHLQGGRDDQAEPLLRAVLAKDPGNPDALHFLGMLTHRRGNTQEAIDLLRRATVIAPGYAAALNNLGNLLKLTGATEQAEACYQRVLALAPDDHNALCNLGSCLRARGDFVGAEKALRRAVEVAPEHVESYNNLGNVLKDLGNTAEAIAAYRASVALDPDHPDGPQTLGLALHGAGRIDEAREVYRNWLTRDPGNPVAMHLLAACSGTDTPTRASDPYVKRVFDAFADEFDAQLAKLGYCAPQLVTAAVGEQLGSPTGRLRVLDAGCGTGLCGPTLRPYASTLVGVDLSPGMLERARTRDLYDTLVEAELVAYLRAHPDSCDLLVSADTLCYFGLLEEFSEAAAGSLAPGGLLVFTVEMVIGDPPAQGYRLASHGRYNHTESYVRRVLADAGFAQIDTPTATLRTEGGAPVIGLVVSAKRSARNTADAAVQRS